MFCIREISTGGNMDNKSSTANNESDHLDTSFQLDWIRNHEIEELDKIESPTVWQAVIEHDLNINFESADERITELLESNMAMLRSMIPGNQIYDDIRNALSRFPRMYWLLKDANNSYQGLKSGKLDSRTKAHSMINLYSDIANGAFIESLFILRNMEQYVTDKKLYQTKLRPLTELFTSARLVEAGRDYSEYANLITPDIRNATDHGGIEVRTSDYRITYTDKQHNTATVIKSFWQIESEVNKLLKGLSAFVKTMLDLSFFARITTLKIGEESPEMVKTAWYRLQLSTLLVACELVEVSTITENRTQLSIDLNGIDAMGNEKFVFCLQTALYAADTVVPNSQQLDRVFVTYASARATNTFIAVPMSSIWDYINGNITGEDLFHAVNDDVVLITDTVEDPVPIQDIEYHDIKGPGYLISKIENPNVENAIRFTANVEIPRATRPNHVKTLIPKIIQQLRDLPSGGDSKVLMKHGLVPADVVFLYVYKDASKGGGVSPDNGNFIATVQFDINRRFLINFDGSPLFAFRKMRYEGNIEYGWNPKFGEGNKD